MPAVPKTEVLDEVQLVEAVAAENRAAFRDLYQRYSTPLFSYAVRLLGDAGAAEEALQDTLVKIWDHAGDFDARKAQPFTWAVTILKRTCIDHLRKRQRASRSVVNRFDDHLTTDVPTADTTRQTAELNEARSRLRDALAKVPSPQRDVLELALYSTLTHAEIATRVSLPVGTVKTWIRRGLLELRNQLNESVP